MSASKRVSKCKTPEEKLKILEEKLKVKTPEEKLKVLEEELKEALEEAQTAKDELVLVQAAEVKLRRELKSRDENITNLMKDNEQLRKEKKELGSSLARLEEKNTLLARARNDADERNAAAILANMGGVAAQGAKQANLQRAPAATPLLSSQVAVAAQAGPQPTRTSPQTWKIVQAITAQAGPQPAPGAAQILPSQVAVAAQAGPQPARAVPQILPSQVAVAAQAGPQPARTSPPTSAQAGPQPTRAVAPVAKQPQAKLNPKDMVQEISQAIGAMFDSAAVEYKDTQAVFTGPLMPSPTMDHYPKVVVCCNSNGTVQVEYPPNLGHLVEKGDLGHHLRVPREGGAPALGSISTSFKKDEHGNDTEVRVVGFVWNFLNNNDLLFDTLRTLFFHTNRLNWAKHFMYRMEHYLQMDTSTSPICIHRYSIQGSWNKPIIMAAVMAPFVPVNILFHQKFDGERVTFDALLSSFGDKVTLEGDTRATVTCTNRFKSGKTVRIPGLVMTTSKGEKRFIITASLGSDFVAKAIVLVTAILEVKNQGSGAAAVSAAPPPGVVPAVRAAPPPEGEPAAKRHKPADA